MRVPSTLNELCLKPIVMIVATLLVSYSITERMVLSAFLCLCHISSYAASISLSTLTLSSTTDGSSASSALFGGCPGQETKDSGNSDFCVQLKKLYRNISNLENKIKQEDSMKETNDLQTSRVLLK